MSKVTQSNKKTVGPVKVSLIFIPFEVHCLSLKERRLVSQYFTTKINYHRCIKNHFLIEKHFKEIFVCLEG